MSKPARSPITTHVLDVSKGKPAIGIAVLLEQAAEKNSWKELASGLTDADGRVGTLLPVGAPLAPGTYRLTFSTLAYFKKMGERSFYPSITIAFEVADGAEHYHVPLLLSAFGYSTYRGS